MSKKDDERATQRREILDGVMLEASPDAFEMHEATIFALNRKYEDAMRNAEYYRNLYVAEHALRINQDALIKSQERMIEVMEHQKSILARMAGWFTR